MFKNLIFIIALLATTFAFANDHDAEMSLNTDESIVNWTGEKVTGKHWGSVKFEEGKLHLKEGKIVGGVFHVDMTTIISEDLKDDKKTHDKLIGHLKSDDFFNVNQFPLAKFEITKAVPNPFAKGDKPNYTISGNLTIRDKTHPITVPAKITVHEDKVMAEATLTFDRSKYNVKYGSDSFFDNLGDKVIYDEVPLELKIIAMK